MASNGAPEKIHCVSFDLQPDVYEIPPRSEFSAEEMDQSFYCRLELEAMAAAAMDPANEKLSEGGGNRGLERYTISGSTRLEIHRVQVVAAVLREQQRLKDAILGKNMGCCSDIPHDTTPMQSKEEQIAIAAATISQECQELAYMQGYNDEVEAYAGTPSISTDVIELPKPGFFTGLSKQLVAAKDLAFLARQSKQARG